MSFHKKILVVTHAGGSPYHGPNMRWYNLGLSLKRIGIETNIVSSSYFHKYYVQPALSDVHKKEIIDGIEYNWLKTNIYRVGSIFQIFNQLLFVYRCFTNINNITSTIPDLVVASSPHPFVIFPAKYIAKKFDIKLVYEARDLWPEVLIQLGRCSIYHPYAILLRFTERYALNNADFLTSVKQGDKDYYERYYKKKIKNFKFLPNGLSKDSIKPTAISIDFCRLRDVYDFIIVYTGAISAYYDIKKIVKLSEELQPHQNIGIILIGNGSYLNDLKDSIARKNLKNIHILPQRKKSEIFSIIKEADACYLSLAEIEINQYGISCNKIYDYMYSAKPIIAHYKPSKYDPIYLSGCGVVAKKGEESFLVENILEWSKSPDLCSKLGKKGKDFFDNNFDFSNIALNIKKEFFS